LWGLQSRSYGYDMRPDTRLTPSQLKGFFTPWHYAGVKMAWEGRWVSVQPVAATKSAPAPAPMPKSTIRPTATPRPAPKASPTLSPSPAPTATPAASLTVTATPAEVAALPEPVASASGRADSATITPATPVAGDSTGGLLAGLALLVVAALAVIGGLAFRARRSP
jgi:hypothetical protein